MRPALLRGNTASGLDSKFCESAECLRFSRRCRRSCSACGFLPNSAHSALGVFLRVGGPSEDRPHWSASYFASERPPCSSRWSVAPLNSREPSRLKFSFQKNMESVSDGAECVKKEGINYVVMEQEELMPPAEVFNARLSVLFLNLRVIQVNGVNNLFYHVLGESCFDDSALVLWCF